MLTNNSSRHDQAWTVGFVRFAVVLATILLSALLVLIGSNVQAPL